MKYFILPFGCQMNRSDSERVKTVLNESGFIETEDENDPEIMVKGIISCSVRQQSIDRVYGRIRNWNLEKSHRPLLTFITGCVLPADREKFLKLFDIVFAIDELAELPGLIGLYGVPSRYSLKVDDVFPRAGDRLSSVEEAARQPEPGRAPETGDSSDFGNVKDAARRRIEDFWKVKPRYSSPVEAFVPIQNGCDKFCTFCAVPYTRGREVSRPSSDILDEVRRLVSSGCRSITLLGQNVNSYGLDRKGEELSFPALMREVGEIGAESGRSFWTYFTSPHPRDITRDLLEVMAGYDVLAKWIHLPLQSGDDKVLLKMNRNHTMERYRTVVGDIRAILPSASLFTDIIVGFAGESAEQFEHTAQAMREFVYDMAYIARYSPRPGAASSRWDDDVPAAEKERRYHVLSDLLLETAAPVNRNRIGKRCRVLITGAHRKTGLLTGYTEGRIPVRIASGAAAIGNFVEMEVTSAQPLSIEGRVTAGSQDRR